MTRSLSFARTKCCFRGVQTETSNRKGNERKNSPRFYFIQSYQRTLKIQKKFTIDVCTPYTHAHTHTCAHSLTRTCVILKYLTNTDKKCTLENFCIPHKELDILSLYLKEKTVHQSACLFVYPSVCWSVHQSVYLFISRPIHLSVCLLILPSPCLSVNSSARFPVRLSVSRSIDPFLCLPFHLHPRLSVHTLVSLSYNLIIIVGFISFDFSYVLISFWVPARDLRLDIAS